MALRSELRKLQGILTSMILGNLDIGFQERVGESLDRLKLSNESGETWKAII